MATFADLELKWLQDNGAVATNRMDAWQQFLGLQGFEYTTFSDSRFNWLQSLGYTGTTQDMLNQLWEACPVISTPSASAWVDTESYEDTEVWVD